MQTKVICFGEVLWDVFPDYKRIGGAPLNVALRLHQLGFTSSIISCIGADQQGFAILDYIRAFDFPTTSIQTHKSLATGQVLVSLDQDKNACYEIVAPVAWDEIQLTPQIEAAVRQADCFVFGSLASRNAISKSTLKTLLKGSTFSVFDVNFRAPFYSKSTVLSLLEAVDMIKLNEEELDEVFQWLNSTPCNLEAKIKYLSQKTKTSCICVTLGSKGAALWFENQMYYSSGYPIVVADTVGAGDSFLAGLLSKLLVKEAPQKALHFACALGALVASKQGANEPVSSQEIDRLMHIP